MIAKKLHWIYSPLARDKKHHESFARSVINIFFEYTGKRKPKIDIVCVEDDQVRTGGPMQITIFFNERNYQLTFVYLDAIPLDGLEVFKSRMSAFLNNNGYELNPITYAIFALIHELGHIEYTRIMVDNDILDLSIHVDDTNNSLVSLALRGGESVLTSNGVHVRYLISGSEMYCDGYAMTYFRAVVNAMLDRGFDETVLLKPFNLEDLVEVE